MTDTTETALRTWARLDGIDEDAVIADYRHGGALAQLVRRVIGAPHSQQGRSSDDEENWRRFVLVVIAKRRIGRGRREKGRNAFELAADLGQGGPSEDLGGSAPERFKSTYYRSKRRGWKDEDVPSGLAAFYSKPPIRGDKIPP